jgi:ATP-binding cassette subfamily C (CFTR/MRP) protein 1
MFSLGLLLFMVSRISILFYYALKTAKTVHEKMTGSLLFASLNEFFERIPLGRILNRLTKDL